MNIIYYIVFFFWYLLSLLPLRLLYVLSDLLFYPCFYLIRYRRKVVHQNLKEVFYGETEEELLHTEKQFYHFFCDYIVETIKLFSISKKEMMRRMTFGGVEEMRQAMQRENKKMCFIYLGHYCNWEYVASLSYWLEDMHCGQIYKFGELPYRSLRFDVQTINKEYYQNTAVTNYPNDYDFTRITEHKYFLDEKSDKTTISIEYPELFEIGKNERYYPISNDKNNSLYNKYLEESKNIKKLHLFGRLGDYKYYNMDLAVERVFKLFNDNFKI